MQQPRFKMRKSIVALNVYNDEMKEKKIGASGWIA